MARPSLSLSARCVTLRRGQVLAHHLQLALRRLVARRARWRRALQDAAQGRAGHDVLGRQAVHLGEAGVGDDEALVGIEHGEALEHVGQRRVEQHVLPPEPGVGPAQIAERAVQHLEREDREHEVGGNAERQGGEGDQGGFLQQGAQAGDDHGPADLLAVDQDRQRCGNRSEPAGLAPCSSTIGALLIPDALQDGRGVAVARLERRASPAASARQSKGSRRMKCSARAAAHLGLDRERLGTADVADHGVADRDRESREQRRDGAERSHQPLHRDRPHGQVQPVHEAAGGPARPAPLEGLRNCCRIWPTRPPARCSSRRPDAVRADLAYQTTRADAQRRAWLLPSRVSPDVDDERNGQFLRCR